MRAAGGGVPAALAGGARTAKKSLVHPVRYWPDGRYWPGISAVSAPPGLSTAGPARTSPDAAGPGSAQDIPDGAGEGRDGHQGPVRGPRARDANPRPGYRGPGSRRSGWHAAGWPWAYHAHPPSTAPGDAVDGGCSAADAPPHAATAQAPASAPAARNVRRIMLPSMRRLPPAVPAVRSVAQSVSRQWAGMKKT
jgi:hypothetical protein